EFAGAALPALLRIGRDGRSKELAPPSCGKYQRAGSPLIAASRTGLCAADRGDAEAGDLHLVAERVVHIDAERTAVAHIRDAYRRELCFGSLAVEIGDREGDVIDHRAGFAPWKPVARRRIRWPRAADDVGQRHIVGADAVRLFALFAERQRHVAC